MWTKIGEQVNKYDYMSKIDRHSDRVKATGEVFTPTDLVIEILQKMLEDNPWCLQPGKTVLDPACGDGQFLVAVKYYKQYILENAGYRSWLASEKALEDIYGCDIMEDNVELCKRRLGGGNIICDNTLDPQTELGKKWFGKPTLESLWLQ